MLNVSMPKFREATYLEANPDVRQGIAKGTTSDGLAHYLSHGIDEQRAPRISREFLNLQGCVDRYLVSDSGYVAIFGWLGDEAVGNLEWRLFGSEFNVEISPASIFRHARQDVEETFRDGPYDYGFVVFERSLS
jgi:hypothetical protein